MPQRITNTYLYVGIDTKIAYTNKFEIFVTFFSNN